MCLHSFAPPCPTLRAASINKSRKIGRGPVSRGDGRHVALGCLWGVSWGAPASSKTTPRDRSMGRTRRCGGGSGGEGVGTPLERCGGGVQAEKGVGTPVPPLRKHPFCEDTRTWEGKGVEGKLVSVVVCLPSRGWSGTRGEEVREPLPKRGGDTLPFLLAL